MLVYEDTSVEVIAVRPENIYITKKIIDNNKVFYVHNTFNDVIIGRIKNIEDVRYWCNNCAHCTVAETEEFINS